MSDLWTCFGIMYRGSQSKRVILWNTIITADERENLAEIYASGYFIERVLEYKQDASSNDLVDEEILLLIEAENNLDLFSEYEYRTNPCELCGSHGSISVKIGDKRFFLKEW